MAFMLGITEGFCILSLPRPFRLQILARRWDQHSILIAVANVKSLTAFARPPLAALHPLRLTRGSFRGYHQRLVFVFEKNKSTIMINRG